MVFINNNNNWENTMQKYINQSSEQNKYGRGNKRSLENILDEHKILALQLFEQADIVSENDTESTLLSIKQAKLLDDQLALLIEAQSIKLKNNKDIIALLQLWKSEEIYDDDITANQELVLHLLEHFENTLG